MLCAFHSLSSKGSLSVQPLLDINCNMFVCARAVSSRVLCPSRMLS